MASPINHKMADSHKDKETTALFSPPLYIQRYTMVTNLVDRVKARKVIHKTSYQLKYAAAGMFFICRLPYV